MAVVNVLCLGACVCVGCVCLFCGISCLIFDVLDV